ncbi:MAG: ABC transporter ATP-binding protein [Verrucomicrobiae bacterium]|nr:ABC transporter ATP-binding protein [Verrucomicrobiae bacterium]
MNAAITITGLGKRYRYGGARSSGNLREDLTAWARGLFRRDGRSRPTLHQVHEQRLDASPEYFWALKDINLQAQPGEMLGIIGPNGAGKSTLLKILSRITPPTAGRIEYRGRLTSLLEVGTGFHRELTGRENIFLNGSILGMSRAEITRKLDQIVAFAEIEKFIDTPVKFYSSGMYVRLAFAVAAHLDPDILLIDEVLAVGDLHFQRKCMGFARRLRDSNATVLVVSHNMFAVKAMCDRVIYLRGGRLIHDGDVQTAIGLYEKDSHLEIAPWAQGILGTSDASKCPIVFTDVRMLDEQGNPRTVFEFGERMRVRLTYEAREPVANPNFCVGFSRSDNVHCCVHSAFVDGLRIPLATGRGVVEVLTPPLKLTAELYTLNIGIWDSEFKRLYSAQVGGNFHVRHALFSTHFGVFYEPAQWKTL